MKETIPFNDHFASKRNWAVTLKIINNMHHHHEHDNSPGSMHSASSLPFLRRLSILPQSASGLLYCLNVVAIVQHICPIGRQPSYRYVSVYVCPVSGLDFSSFSLLILQSYVDNFSSLTYDFIRNSVYQVNPKYNKVK